MLTVVLLIFASLVSATRQEAGEELSELVKSTPIIATGTVTDVEEPPVTWGMGNYLVGQNVKFRVEKVLKGKLEDEEIVVHYAIVKGSPKNTPDRPQLSPDIFYKGRTIILFIQPATKNANPDPKEQPRKFIETDWSHKVLEANEENIRLIGAHIH
jgi:hypothetical protein